MINVGLFRKVCINFALAIILAFSFVFAYTWQQLVFRKLNVPMFGSEVTIEQGMTLKQFAKQLNKNGILNNPRLFTWYAAITGGANNIKAGEYRILPGTTPRQLLKMMVEGEVTQYTFTVIEGWRFTDLFAALQENPKIKITLAGLTQDQIIKKLNLPYKHLEGLFLADTYYINAGTTDVEFLRRANIALQEKLLEAWSNRAANCILKDPYEVLILASIIEKESGLPHELTEISGVFQRRITKGMRLQADPTIAYAIADQLQGPLLRRHLKIDTPYNTYLYYGLPPTPIAIPSLQAIRAALNPDSKESLYFVASGKSGGHTFSNTLKEHIHATREARKAQN